MQLSSIALQKKNVVLPRVFLERMIRDNMNQEICEVFQLLAVTSERSRYMEIGVQETMKLKLLNN